MQNRLLTIVFSVVLAFSSGLCLFLWLSWQKTEADIQTGAEASTSLILVNQNLYENISTTEANLASTGEEIQLLGLELGQLTDNKNALREQAALYQSQRLYLKEVLDWYNQNYFFQDVNELIDAYATATGNVEP